MTIQPQDLLGALSGGRVLDVATGSGGFVHFLRAGLAGYSEIIGVDTSLRGAAAFASAFEGVPEIQFGQMDALRLNFPDAAFDTVSIANSLHHFDQPRLVLNEMLRVLRPGGYFILAEMYHDGQSVAQMTHVLLHHWWAAVDRAEGMVHHETYRREQLLGMFQHLGLVDTVFHDLADTEADPFDAETLAELEGVIIRYIQRAAGRLDLQSQGEQLRLRLRQVGFQSASSLLAIGRH